MRQVELEGPSRHMGHCFGEEFRDEIQTLYHLRVANALKQALEYGGKERDEESLLISARSSLPWVREFHAGDFQELEGIAEGAGLTVEQVLALNGLTDFRDHLAWSEGCTLALIPRDGCADGEARLIQTWDLATDNQPFMINVLRRPNDGPETWAVTVMGGLSIMGLNSEGIAVGTTNLRTKDARAGIPYTSLLHRALGVETAEAGIAGILKARRAGGHAYALLDAEGEGALVECAATKVYLLLVLDQLHVQTNHCQFEVNQKMEAETPQASSRARKMRLTELLLLRWGQLDVTYLEKCLEDTHGGELAICRNNFRGISTNAAVIITPGQGHMRVCHGIPGPGKWKTLL